MYTSKRLFKWTTVSDEPPWTSWGALFSDPDISALLWMSSSIPPPSELSSHALCVSSRSSPFAVSHHQHHRHYPHHHQSSSSSPSSFDLRFRFFDIHLPRHFNFCKQAGEAKEGRRFGWTEIFPSFCQSGDLLAHDVHIDKPKAWCQQKRARSHVGFRTESSPAPPVTQLPFVSPLLKYVYTLDIIHKLRTPFLTSQYVKMTEGTLCKRICLKMDYP